ncbi:hypothetical protein JCM17961_47400 [Endothiovibrio diazotrophicus]
MDGVERPVEALNRLRQDVDEAVPVIVGEVDRLAAVAAGRDEGEGAGKFESEGAGP